MAVQGGVKLRILGVGASITVGYGPGTDGNGYRKRLQENLAGEWSDLVPGPLLTL